MNEEYLLKKSIEKIGKFARFGSKPGLERVSELLSRLDNPHKNLNVIHVGGTNGKGSVCRYVYSVLQEAGYKTGLFISPYIEEFVERIEYNGKTIAPEDLYRITEIVTEKAAEMVSEGLESPTEFEVLTAIALKYYEEKNPDVVILEVGLGGRGDSTNVVEKPLISCIASVSYDHMDYLGDTLEKIAGEKAGIIKAGCPLVFASEDGGVIKVLEEKAHSLNAPIFNVFDYQPEITGEYMDSVEFSVKLEKSGFERIKTGMSGRHQMYNAVCALKIFEILQTQYGFKITEESVRTGLAEAKQPGRIEIISENPLVILDGSHNRDSVRALKEWAEKNFDADERILIVTGVLRDKEYELIAEMLAEIGDDFIVTEPDSPRKLDADKYKEVIEGKIKGKGSVTAIKNARDAVRYSMNKYNVNKSNKECYKALIFTGSLYMIGIVRTMFKGIDGGRNCDECK